MLVRGTWHAAHDTVAVIEQRCDYTHGQALFGRSAPSQRKACGARTRACAPRRLIFERRAAAAATHREAAVSVAPVLGLGVGAAHAQLRPERGVACGDQGGDGWRRWPSVHSAAAAAARALRSSPPRRGSALTAEGLAVAQVDARGCVVPGHLVGCNVIGGAIGRRSGRRSLCRRAHCRHCQQEQRHHRPPLRCHRACCCLWVGGAAAWRRLVGREPAVEGARKATAICGRLSLSHHTSPYTPHHTNIPSPSLSSMHTPRTLCPCQKAPAPYAS